MQTKNEKTIEQVFEDLNISTYEETQENAFLMSAPLDEIKNVQLHIATKDEMLSWSSGEVLKPETINYKSHKPEKKGLFDETIFGPSKDFKCPSCGKKHKRSDVGKKCLSCGNSIIESKMVRRRKMGHIKLHSPVAHIWYSKIDYSVIRSVIGIKQVDYEAIIYFKSYVIYDDGGVKGVKKNTIININNAASSYFKILKDILEETTDPDYRIAIDNKIKSLIQEAQTEAGQNHGIDFNDYNYFIHSISKIKIGTGAETIKKMIQNLDVAKEIKSIKMKLQTKQQNNTLYRRLRVLTSFKESGQDPASMIMEVIPIIPPDLRPLIQLDGGRHSTVDVNELYRRVIIRNNRLGQWLELKAPALIIQNEKRMLQEAVDALFDNTRKPQPVNSKDGRPLKSLAENLKGKQGRFRQNLLGKRVDYSGRSVIVVGPELKLHQVGLPKQMVVKLFEPFIVYLLVKEEVAKNTKQAKKLIELYDDRIWKYADRVIKGHPVLINRAPTLHRLSIQAFEPVIVSGKAIQLHPLVTPAFNADFDGDQMAVHLPLSEESKEEAKQLMMSNTNILGPKDGRLILSPSQDMALGTYYLTKKKYGKIGEKKVYGKLSELQNDLDFDNLHEHSIIAIRLTMFEDKFENEIKDGYKYIITTAGRVLLNSKLPVRFRYLNIVNEESFKIVPKTHLMKSIEEFDEKFESIPNEFTPFKKSHIHRIIEIVFERFSEDIAVTLDELKDLGFWYSMLSGSSMAFDDIVEIEDREKILEKADKEVLKLKNIYEDGMLTDDQRYQHVLNVWRDVKDEIQNELQKTLPKNPDNSLFMMMDSGARGNISNFVQLAGLRGSMSKATHEYAALKRQGIIVRSTEEIPIKSSFKTGLSTFEYFLSTHGARKGLSDTATKTAESGYLTRRLVEAAQDIHITEDDCNTDKGLEVKEIYDSKNGSTIETLHDRIIGRYLSKDIVIDGEILAKRNDFVDTELVEKIINAGITRVWIRTVLTCTSKRGVCRKCYGADLSTNKEVELGEAVGIISAQSIGEPGTQLTMRTFHTGGVAGVTDITQGFSRLMELVDANKNPKSSAIISKIHGTVSKTEAIDFDEHGNPISYELSVVGEKETIKYNLTPQHSVRAKEGDVVKPGDKITEGSIRLQELLDTAGRRATQSYLLKEIQRLYRIQGIEVNDKYMEVIIRQMLSKVEVIDRGDSKLYQKQIVSYDQLSDINAELFSKGKKPAYGRPVVMGIKKLPLYSESWLSAASYQRTADALVSASISKQTDILHGVKENLIIGKKIPVGTGVENPTGKYDLGIDHSLEERYEKEKQLQFETDLILDERVQNE